jgi:HEAT repeat protein
MESLVVAVIGGVIVLTVQGMVFLLRQWRRRVNEGEVAAPRPYVRFRRIGYGILRPRIVKRLRRAAIKQRQIIQTQYAKDPMWRVGQVRLLPGSLDPQVELPKVTLAEALAESGGGGSIFVKGESGSGRSSVSALTAVQWSATPLALRIDLSSYNAKEHLLEQALNGLIDRADLERGLALGLVALIFDSFEAVQGDEARAAFDSDLRAIRRRYPDIHFAVLARPEDTPTPALLGSREYTMSTLSSAEIEEAIGSLQIDPAAVLGQMNERTRQLCQSPLALRMILQSYSDDGVVPDDDIELHREFVYALIADPADAKYTLPKLSSSAKMELIAELAYACDNRMATFDWPRAQQVIKPVMTKLVSQYVLPSTIDGLEILRELVSDGILRSERRVLQFVHNSVQEFLTAVALHRRLRMNEVDIGDVANLSTRPEWAHSIVFLAGLLIDATELVQHLRLKNRVLAAECIKTASHVSPAFVDRCIVEALYEYKFGTTSFNYELVSALLLIADKCSEDLPHRIVSEMNHWCQKYPPRPYRELDGIDDRSLLRLLADGEAAPQAVNAVWTLGVRGRNEAVPLLEGFLRDRVDQLDLVSAMALGKLKSQRSSQLLLTTALDKSASANLRSACFNSIGAMGVKDCLPAIADFIRSDEELDASIREDAAWSLNGLAGDLLVDSEQFQALLIDQLSVGSDYARAMFAYLIGRFQVKRGFDSLIALAENPATHAFLLEDVIFSIGELGDNRAVPTIRTLLAHPDTIVRARAIQAAGKLTGFSNEELERFTTAAEPSEIVRDSARTHLEHESAASPATWPAVASDDMRRRR